MTSMTSIYKLNAVKLHPKEIIGNKKLELLEFPPMFSRGVFRTQSNVYDEAFFANSFQKNASW